MGRVLERMEQARAVLSGEVELTVGVVVEVVGGHEGDLVAEGLDGDFA